MANKVYFLPGDVVTIRQDIKNKPEMIVKKKVRGNITIKGAKNDYFQGIECMWFTDQGLLQQSVFNTKDLIKLKK